MLDVVEEVVRANADSFPFQPSDPASLARIASESVFWTADGREHAYIADGRGRTYFLTKDANGDGQVYRLVEFDPNSARETVIETNLTVDANGRIVDRELVSFLQTDPGLPGGERVLDIDPATGQVRISGQNAVLGDFGNLVGAQLGAVIARETGGGPLVQIATSTLLGTALNVLGNTLHVAITGDAFVNGQQLLTLWNAVGTEAGASALGSMALGNLGSQVGGYLSGLLMAELADSIGLDGFEGQLVTTIANIPVSRAITTVINYGLGIGGHGSLDAAFSAAFNPAQLATAGATAIGSLLGSTLGQAVITANSSEAVRELFRQNLVQITRLSQLEREAASLDGESGRLLAQVAQAEGKIAETELQILQQVEDLRAEALKELREIQGKVAELSERKVAAEDQLKRMDVRAPASGIVHQLAIHTVGGVMTPNEPAMLIVPTEDRLHLEGRVAPHDVDQVSLDQPVVIRLLAFNQRTTPELRGAVAWIAGDATRDPQTGQAYFLVRVGVPASELERIAPLRIVAGMQADILIETGARTPFYYLAKPVKDQFAKAFRER